MLLCCCLQMSSSCSCGALTAEKCEEDSKSDQYFTVQIMYSHPGKRRDSHMSVQLLATHIASIIFIWAI